MYCHYPISITHIYVHTHDISQKILFLIFNLFLFLFQEKEIWMGRDDKLHSKKWNDKSREGQMCDTPLCCFFLTTCSCLKVSSKLYKLTCDKSKEKRIQNQTQLDSCSCSQGRNVQLLGTQDKQACRITPMKMCVTTIHSSLSFQSTCTDVQRSKEARYRYTGTPRYTSKVCTQWVGHSCKDGPQSLLTAHSVLSLAAKNIYRQKGRHLFQDTVAPLKYNLCVFKCTCKVCNNNHPEKA